MTPLSSCSFRPKPLSTSVIREIHSVLRAGVLLTKTNQFFFLIMLNFDTILEWEVVLKKSMFGSSYLDNSDFEVNVKNTR